MAPTRIIAPPKRVKTPGVRNWLFFYTCDDGQTYDLEQISAIVGMHRHSFLQRITRYGWDSELILMPSAQKGKFINGEKLISCADGQFYEATGNDEWRALSNKSRSHRLARLPELGSYEKQRLAKRISKATIERSNKARKYDPYGGLPYGSFGSVTICE